MLELRDPLFLLATAAAPLVYWLVSPRTASVSYAAVDLAARAPRTLRARLEKLPALLLAAAVALLAIAAAGPRSGDATTEIKREGIAIALVVDRSGSMDARDFVRDDTGVSRLDAVKRIVARFVAGGDGLDGRADDLIGVIGFARYADAFCPLTLDHRNLIAILDQVGIARERGEDGTAVGEGLALAVERLRRHPATSRVAVLLTDGVSNAGQIQPLQAAQLAAAHDVRVYAIGAGRTGLAPMPIHTPDGRTVLRRTPVELDDKTLRAIAGRTGGRYFHAENADALAEVYAEIDRLERSEIEEVRYLQYTEHYAGFAGAALLCLLGGAAAAGSWLRRLP